MEKVDAWCVDYWLDKLNENEQNFRNGIINEKGYSTLKQHFENHIQKILEQYKEEK